MFQRALVHPFIITSPESRPVCVCVISEAQEQLNNGDKCLCVFLLLGEVRTRSGRKSILLVIYRSSTKLQAVEGPLFYTTLA